MKIKIIIVSFLFTALGIKGCSFTITNDQKKPYTILVEGTGNGTTLKPGETTVIKARNIAGKKENRVTFLEVDGKNLYQKYTLIDTGCATGKEEKLKISDVEKLIVKPTARLKAQRYKQEGVLSRWWHSASDTVKGWFSGAQQTTKIEAAKGAKQAQKVAAAPSQADAFKKSVEKCEAKPSEKQEQCYFDLAKTMPSDVLPTGNYE